MRGSNKHALQRIPELGLKTVERFLAHFRNFLCARLRRNIFSLTISLFNPGCSPDSGVVDYRNRVFGYRNMYVCDGSVISANLGVNPSLTIAALTERAISFIPKACESNWDDAAITAAA